jgi:hypothetical protein
VLEGVLAENTYKQTKSKQLKFIDYGWKSSCEYSRITIHRILSTASDYRISFQQFMERIAQTRETVTPEEIANTVSILKEKKGRSRDML